MQRDFNHLAAEERKNCRRFIKIRERNAALRRDGTFYLACWKIIADILPNRAGLSCAKIAGGKSGRQLYSIIQTPFSARKTPLNLLNSALFHSIFQPHLCVASQPLPLNVAAKYSDDNQRRNKIEKDFEVCSRSIFCGAHDIRNRFECSVFVKKQRRLDAK